MGTVRLKGRRSGEDLRNHPAVAAAVTPDYIVMRLQEINTALLPDFPGKTPNADSVGRARKNVLALIADIRGAA